MFDHLNIVATVVFVFFFGVVSVLGFVAAHWKAADLGHINEWGLGGRRFGRWITWFLLGGDLYTAYTVIAIPAVVFAIGAFGFFAVPYTIIVYPFLVLDAAAPVGGLAKARLHYGRGFCARPLRPQRAGGCGRGHRNPGDNALHRPATRRAREGHSGARLLRPGNHGARADHHRLRDSRALHLQERAARAGDDRLCQGRDDLHFRHRGHRDHSLRARGLRCDLRSGE